MYTCDKCRGAMLPERAVDLDAGLAITVLACLNCGRRKVTDPEPRPITARHWARRLWSDRGRSHMMSERPLRRLFEVFRWIRIGRRGRGPSISESTLLWALARGPTP